MIMFQYPNTISFCVDVYDIAYTQVIP
ncbi:apolipoprotein H [Staphylococcus phage JPL-50]|uniref:Apolipoprotein H n=1 Tax=Staphylococcus phage JPL-50 TaxID=2851077 RepID=A0A8F3C9P8_9CAUD|nr:apolipoprotein H [Staphylococcus phage JPL-50]QWY14500.1 apolipoprotein H [Staphylococcus phage JPL-50]